tara:strand:+ start:1242 stop:1490 length:249 start_codon:yes stop_codon:yes gene_type:complete
MIPKNSPISLFLHGFLIKINNNRNERLNVIPIDFMAQTNPKQIPKRKNLFLFSKIIFIITPTEKLMKEKNNDSVRIVFEKET